MAAHVNRAKNNPLTQSNQGVVSIYREGNMYTSSPSRRSLQLALTQQSKHSVDTGIG